MLDAFSIRNFKACKEVDIPLAPLTVLTGLNSSGKSSVLQSLALIRQTYDRSLITGLTLNGDWTSLGTAQDVLYEDAESEEITIAFLERGARYEWTCTCPKDAYVLPLQKSPERPADFLHGPFQYLSADRITPATTYPNAPQHVRDAGELGSAGQYTADFLARNRSVEVAPLRRFSGSKSAPTPGLFDQTSAWLQCLSPGVTLDVEQLQGTDDVRLLYRYGGRRRNVKSRDYRPTNVGFGLTYVLPIVVAALASKSSAVVLMENPEAHLHPQGQVALATLLAQCTRDRIQVILETHSDHLLNGVRLAVKRGIVQPEAVAIHYFSRSVATGEVKVQSPVVQSNGRLSFWPEGFFDQWDKSLDELLGD